MLSFRTFTTKFTLSQASASVKSAIHCRLEAARPYRAKPILRLEPPGSWKQRMINICRGSPPKKLLGPRQGCRRVRGSLKNLQSSWRGLKTNAQLSLMEGLGRAQGSQVPCAHLPNLVRRHPEQNLVSQFAASRVQVADTA